MTSLAASSLSSARHWDTSILPVGPSAVAASAAVAAVVAAVAKLLAGMDVQS